MPSQPVIQAQPTQDPSPAASAPQTVQQDNASAVTTIEQQPVAAPVQEQPVYEESVFAPAPVQEQPAAPVQEQHVYAPAPVQAQPVYAPAPIAPVQEQPVYAPAPVQEQPAYAPAPVQERPVFAPAPVQEQPIFSFKPPTDFPNNATIDNDGSLSSGRSTGTYLSDDETNDDLELMGGKGDSTAFDHDAAAMEDFVV